MPKKQTDFFQNICFLWKFSAFTSCFWFPVRFLLPFCVIHEFQPPPPPDYTYTSWGRNSYLWRHRQRRQHRNPGNRISRVRGTAPDLQQRKYVGNRFRSFARKLSKCNFLSPASNLQFRSGFKMIDHSGDIPGINIERMTVTVSEILRFDISAVSQILRLTKEQYPRCKAWHTPYLKFDM